MSNESAELQLITDASASLRMTGALRAAAVSDLLGRLPVSAEHYRVELSGLEAVDSAGLALLGDWQRRLTDAGGGAEFVDPPAGLKRLAQIGGVDTLLGWIPNNAGDN